jgi:hypothetical protein
LRWTCPSICRGRPWPLVMEGQPQWPCWQRTTRTSSEVILTGTPSTGGAGHRQRRDARSPRGTGGRRRRRPDADWASQHAPGRRVWALEGLAASPPGWPRRWPGRRGRRRGWCPQAPPGQPTTGSTRGRPDADQPVSPRPGPGRGRLRLPGRRRAAGGQQRPADKHRLNRGGDRALNRALHTVAITPMPCHPETRAYQARRTAQGKTPRDIRRCIKRAIARRLYPIMESAARQSTTRQTEERPTGCSAVLPQRHRPEQTQPRRPRRRRHCPQQPTPQDLELADPRELHELLSNPSTAGGVATTP